MANGHIGRPSLPLTVTMTGYVAMTDWEICSWHRDRGDDRAVIPMTAARVGNRTPTAAQATLMQVTRSEGATRLMATLSGTTTQTGTNLPPHASQSIIEKGYKSRGHKCAIRLRIQPDGVASARMSQCQSNKGDLLLPPRVGRLAGYTGVHPSAARAVRMQRGAPRKSPGQADLWCDPWACSSTP
jgi:hypothetical protein